MRYVVTTLVLIVLTGINIGLALIDLRGFNGVVTLVIATVQVVIMVLVFMRLRESSAMTRLVGIAGLMWLGILLVGTLDDVLTRNWLPVPGK